MWLINLFRKKRDVNPEDYGWEKKGDGEYEKGDGYALYKSRTGWVLDKYPKDGPGVVARFGNILTDIDMEQANGFAEYVPRPTRSMHKRRGALGAGLAKRCTDSFNTKN